MTSCKICGQQWGGYNTCHCVACCTTFSTVDAADKHRAGFYGKGRYCVNPEEAGLVPLPRSYVCWGFPADGSWLEDTE